SIRFRAGRYGESSSGRNAGVGPCSVRRWRGEGGSRRCASRAIARRWYTRHRDDSGFVVVAADLDPVPHHLQVRTASTEQAPGGRSARLDVVVSAGNPDRICAHEFTEGLGEIGNSRPCRRFHEGCRRNSKMMNTMLNRVRRALSPMGLSARVLISVVVAGAIVSACDVHGVTAPGILTSMTV